MRLLLFNYEFPPVGGGGGLVTAHLAREYARRGHDVYVLTSAYGDLPRFEVRDGYRIERVPALRLDPNVAQVHEMLTYALSSAWVALWREGQFRPDAVQVFFGVPSGLGAYLLKWFRRTPYVVFLGGRDVPRPDPDPPYYKYLYDVLRPVIREIWRCASSVVACSEGLRELASETDPARRIVVIPDGIDLERFMPAVHVRRTAVRVLGIGRLIPRKGFDTLLRATAIVKDLATAPFTVDIIGEGPEREALGALAEELGVASLVRFVGAVPYDALPKHYASADVYVLASHAEGMPLVVLEAMATGLPIVATDVQGVVELVADGENGRRFPVKDALALAERLTELIDDADKRAEYGAASRRRVEKYDWTNIADAYLDLLERAAAERDDA